MPFANSEVQWREFQNTLDHAKNLHEAELLLLEWFKWWEESDEAPAKMPDALHVKTAVYFVERKYA